jgi:hypothetical protein
VLALADVIDSMSPKAKAHDMAVSAPRIIGGLVFSRLPEKRLSI